jgi:hypothetical protein
MTKKLRIALNASIMRYIKAFEKKQNCVFEFAVSDDLLGIIYIADYYLSINDIIYDIDKDLPQGLIFEWYWSGLEAYEKSGQSMKLDSYATGLRFQDLTA